MSTLALAVEEAAECDPVAAAPRPAIRYDVGAVVALVLSAVAVAPFVAGFLFIHPSWDDPSFYHEVTTRGFLRAQLLWFNAFSGRYASDAIVSLLSLSVHTLWLYRLICFGIFALLVLSVYRLLRTVLRLPRLETAAITGLVVATHLVVSPGVAEGLFWLTGSATYTLGVAFLFFAIAEMLRSLARRGGTWKVAAWIVVVVGMNEMFLLLLGGFVALLIGHSLATQRSVDRRLLVWLGVAAVASIVSIAAPGNWVRLDFTRGPLQAKPTLGAALTLAAHSLVRQGYYLFQAGPTLFLLLLGLAFSHGAGGRRRWAGWTFEAARLAAFGLLFYGVIAFFTYILPVPPIPRVMHAVYMPMIVVALFLVLQPTRRIARTPLSPLLVALFLVGFASGVVRSGSGVRNAARELARGEWTRYDAEVTARAELAARNPGRDLVVPPIAARPATLFVFDIEGNPALRHNIMYARFYGLRTMVARDAEPRHAEPRPAAP